MIEIDGSYGEGGGQLARTAVALSAITRKPVRIFNVRARRDEPGLAPQHLAALRAVGAICAARTEGLELGSTAIAFEPDALKGGEYHFDVGTAGSVTLVLQAVLPVMLACRSASRFTITGGTDIRQSPPVDYVGEVLLRHLAHMGAHVDFRVRRRGYYPRGGGEVAVEITPARLHAIQWTSPGHLRSLRGAAHVAGLPAHIPERMRDAALAEGESTFTVREVTTHARTAMWLIEQFLPVRFVEDRPDGFYRVRVQR